MTFPKGKNKPLGHPGIEGLLHPVRPSQSHLASHLQASAAKAVKLGSSETLPCWDGFFNWIVTNI